MFLKKERMENAYKKHLERIQKKKNSKVEPSKSSRKRIEPMMNKKEKLPPSINEKTSNYHRDFTSFGSKMPTTPSSSKRSSNDVVKKRKSNDE